jgi:hypothetical protein
MSAVSAMCDEKSVYEVKDHVKEEWSEEYEAVKRDKREIGGEWSVTVEAPNVVILWDGTRLEGPNNWQGLYAELQAVCGDFEFLLNSKTFFSMRYDPGSFTNEVALWLETDFEPTVNCIAKHQLLTIETNEDGEILMTVHNQASKDQTQQQHDHDDDHDHEDENEDDQE